MTTETPTAPDRRLPTSAPSLRRILRLARKELTEILRDRRTIVTLLVMPLLLYLLLAIGFAQFVPQNKAANPNSQIRIGFADDADQKDWVKLLGDQEPGQPSKLAYFGANNPKEPGDTRGIGVEDALRAGQLELILKRRSEERWEVLYSDDSLASREALAQIQELVLSTEVKRLDAQLRAAKIAPELSLRLVPIAQRSEESGFSLAVFVPLVLLLMTITGAVYPAIDLTAGERERGTLEVLVAAPIPRFSVLAGKYLAVLTVAVLTAVVNLAGMTVSLLVSGFTSKEFGDGARTMLILFEIFVLVLLFAAFFSAVLLVVTSFARSFKEAQAYLIPLMVVSLAPGLVALIPGLELSLSLALVPLLNIVLLARDLLRGQAHLLSASLAIISTAGYAVLALMLAARVFGAEGVLYGESSGWRELFRRR